MRHSNDLYVMKTRNTWWMPLKAVDPPKTTPGPMIMKKCKVHSHYICWQHCVFYLGKDYESSKKKSALWFRSIQQLQFNFFVFFFGDLLSKRKWYRFFRKYALWLRLLSFINKRVLCVFICHPDKYILMLLTYLLFNFALNKAIVKFK